MDYNFYNNLIKNLKGSTLFTDRWIGPSKMKVLDEGDYAMCPDFSKGSLWVKIVGNKVTIMDNDKNVVDHNDKRVKNILFGD